MKPDWLVKCPRLRGGAVTGVFLNDGAVGRAGAADVETETTLLAGEVIGA